VIGNPPYIKEYTNRSAFDGFRETSKYYKGKMDLWYGFACHGLDLLANNGVLCFIATNNWTTNSGASKLRNKVIADAKIIQLLDFGSYMIFEDSASIQTMIMIFQNNKDNDRYVFDYRKLDKLKATKADAIALLDTSQTEAVYLEPNIFKDIYLNSFLSFSGSNDKLLEKIKKNVSFLSEKEATNGIHPHYDFVNNKIKRKHPFTNVGEGVFGLSHLEKNSLTLSQEENKLIKPYFTTEQINRYITYPDNTLWLIYTTSKFKNPDSLNEYPNIKQHLDKFSEVITSDNKPYGLHRAREERFFKGEKIISQRKCVGRPSFSYSNFDCYVSAAFYIIKTTRWDMKFLTGLLNSKLVEFWLRHKGKMQGDNFQVDKEPLLNIPIKTSVTAELQIVQLVDQIIGSKQANPQADTSELERKIDQLVYQLYELTDEEITVVEGRK
jgi:adenine-specific DNA-methyltransferase